MKKEELNKGWICPSCNKVFAPTIKMCKKCTDNLKEQKNDTKQLLSESN